MSTETLDIRPFEAAHRDEALRLSRQEEWPHRLEDWTMALALSRGLVALAKDSVTGGSRVVGTVLMTPYKGDAATINMVIVDRDWRGRGLGRRLMDAAMALAGDRPLRLVATREGLPLYEKLGFRETGMVLQHQGECLPVEAPAGTDIVPAETIDIPAIADLDRMAFGADREGLIACLANLGRFVVLRADGTVTGFAALRDFGRGQVIGPVVARDADDAKALIAHLMAACTGAFLRVDTTADTGLGPWLAECGLAHVGGGVTMRRPALSLEPAPVKTFALASQALG